MLGGVSTFLGTFTFMGVLGANIMKNKSQTQRVTPQFAYIPWTFAGVLASRKASMVSLAS